MSGALHIEVSWPARELSPNGRAHPLVQRRFKKAAKAEAGWATKIALGLNRDWHPEGDTIKVEIVASPKPTGPRPDADNLIASCKAHLDGIAAALEVNDRIFEAPTISWAKKSERGSLTVILT